MSDWKISELYEKSWEIVKKNKVLWIFGMAVASFSGGSSFNGNNLDSLVPDTEGPTPTPLPTPAPGLDDQTLLPQNVVETAQASPLDNFSQVLGSGVDNSFLDMLGEVFSQVPTYQYWLLGIEFLGAILFGWFVSILANTWANAGLIQGIQSAINGKQVSIRDMAEKAFPSIRPLAWLFIVPSLILAVAFIVIVALLGLLAFALMAGKMSPWLVAIPGVVALIAYIVAQIYLTLSQIWGLRAVVLDKMSGKEGLTHGYKLTKGRRGAMIILGVVNAILSGIVVGIPLIIVIAILVGGMMGLDSNSALGPILIGIGLILGIAFVIGMMIISGIMTAFKAAVWTLAYHKVKGKND